jgi:hypothetical protein
VRKLWRQCFDHNMKMCGWTEKECMVHATPALAEAYQSTAAGLNTFDELFSFLERQVLPLLDSRDREEFEQLRIGVMGVPQFQLKLETLAKRVGATEKDVVYRFVRGFIHDHPDVHKYLSLHYLEKPLAEAAAMAQKMMELSPQPLPPRRMVAAAWASNSRNEDCVGTHPNSGIPYGGGSPHPELGEGITDTRQAGMMAELARTQNRVVAAVTAMQEGATRTATMLEASSGRAAAAVEDAAARLVAAVQNPTAHLPRGLAPEWQATPHPHGGYTNSPWSRAPNASTMPQSHGKFTSHMDNDRFKGPQAGRTPMSTPRAAPAGNAGGSKGEGLPRNQNWIDLESLPADMWSGPAPPPNRASLGREWQVKDCEFCRSRGVPETDPVTGRSNGHNPRFCDRLAQAIKDKPELHHCLLETPARSGRNNRPGPSTNTSAFPPHRQ